MTSGVRFPPCPFNLGAISSAKIYKIKSSDLIEMVEKVGEGFCISGFTLGVAGLVALIFSPLLAIAYSVVGLIFCLIQQKNKKTKLGKIGIVVNIIGIIFSIVWLIILVKYIIPLLEQQNFPSI